MKNNQEIAVEVCAYSLFSCIAADRAGADRVELCASPYEGGTTPSTGLVKRVLSDTSIQVHAMLRPRGGDFCYDSTEKQTMLAEAADLVAAGVHGLVVGALLPNGDLDVDFLADVRRVAAGVELTCHRAIDVARDPLDVMEGLINLGFVRILSSGQKDKAMDGIDALAEMVERAAGRIQIMAGSGVNPQNCTFFKQIGVNAVHLSARTVRNSLMEYRRPGISMGGVATISEFEVALASEEIIRQTIQQIRAN
jgi:copper homeostasis protein